MPDIHGRAAKESPPAARLIRELYAAVEAAVAEDLKPLGLTPAQFGVLRRIEEAPGSTTAQLARMVYVTPQSMHEIVSQLERATWVQRAGYPHGGRALQTELTEHGRRLLADSDTRVHAIARMVTAELSAAEHRQFTSLLQRCLDTFRRQRNKAT